MSKAITTHAIPAQKYTINKAICRKSGLAFQWQELTTSERLNLRMSVHPLFLEENFLKVERLARHRHACTELDRKVIAALCMFRLTQWNVMRPTPEPEMLNVWVNDLAKEKDQFELRNLYIDIIENHSPEAQKISPFQFNLESANSVDRLLFLISKCKKEQIAAIQEEILAKQVKEEQEAKIMEELEREETEQRKIQTLATSVLRAKTERILAEMQRHIQFPQKRLEKVWREIRREIAEQEFEHRDPEQQQKAIDFVQGWGMKMAKSRGWKEGQNQEKKKTISQYFSRIQEMDLWEDLEGEL